MKAAERRQEILRLATVGGPTGVDQLAEKFGVTASTIRRDLARLSAAGTLARTYGGAIAVSGHETSLAERSLDHREEKIGIGTWAARQVSNGQSVLLDAGTTTAELATCLRGHTQLRVTTTGLTPLAAVGGVPGIEVVCLGGRLRDISQGFVGPLTETALEHMTFDLAFLGADGVTPDKGICEATMEQIRLKEIMCRRSAKVFLLVHGDKVGAAPSHAWGELGRSWTLVTDTTANPGTLREFRARGVSVVVVDRQGHEMR